MSTSDTLAVARDAVATKFQGYSITTLDRLRGGLRALADDAFEDGRRIADAANGRNLTRAQAVDHQAATARLEEAAKLLQAVGDQIELLDRQAIAEAASGDAITYAGDGSCRQIGRRSAASYRDGAPLQRGQSFEGFANSRKLVQAGQEGLSLAKCVRGVVTGTWTDATAERRAMNEGTTTAGGYVVPTPLAASIVDMARARTQVLAAGAQIIPMTSRTLDLPVWAGDPEMTWRSENEQITDDDATLGRVQLVARSLAGIVKISRELLEDNAVGLEDELRAAIAARLALQLDHACLFGAGGEEPTGLANITAVTKTTVGTADGAALDGYAPIIGSVGRLRDLNYSPNAVIMAERTHRDLTTLTDTLGQPLQQPAYLSGVSYLPTTQVPVNGTTGASTDTTSVFSGQWDRLALGLRTDATITVLNERYADLGQVALLVWWRGDVVPLRTDAFDIVRGIRPAA